MSNLKYIFILLCLIAMCLHGQDRVIDSLLTLIKNEKEDTAKVIWLNKAANYYYSTSNYEESISFGQKAFSLAKKINYKRGEAFAYYNLGLAHEYRGDYELAVSYDLKGLRLFEEISDIAYTASLVNNIGNVYFHQKNYKKAEEYYKKTLSIKGRAQIETTYSNLGLVYTYTENYAEALKYYMMALKINEKNNNKRGIGDVYTNMGLIYFEEGDHEKALSLHFKALALYKQFKDKRRLSVSYENIGESYLQLNDLNKALENLEEALKLSKEAGDKEGMQSCYETLVRLYCKKRDYKKAYEMHLLYSDITDVLVNEESNKEITEMNVKYESEKKDKELLKQDAEITRQESRSKQQTIIIVSAIAGIILAAILGLFVLRSYRQKQKSSIAISEQKAEIELKNKEILDSIHYAKRIQGALLAGDQLLKNNLKEHFVLYKPKDIVSGDFYWAHSVDDKFLLCVADCTGHGVPGAFMSLLSISFLNEVTTEKKIIQPDRILNSVRESIIMTLNTQGNEESQDGMDCTLCCFDLKNKKLEYAAANNSFYMIRSGKLIFHSADKMPVGKSPRDKTRFSNHNIGLEKNDIIYILTDGYPDQFGGPKGKKFKYKALEELFLANHHLQMDEQKKLLEQTIESWKGSLEQVDDILIIGIQV